MRYFLRAQYDTSIIQLSTSYVAVGGESHGASILLILITHVAQAPLDCASVVLAVELESRKKLGRGCRAIHNRGSGCDSAEGCPIGLYVQRVAGGVRSVDKQADSGRGGEASRVAS